MSPSTRPSFDDRYLWVQEGRGWIRVRRVSGGGGWDQGGAGTTSSNPGYSRIQDGNGSALADVITPLGDAMVNTNGFLKVMAARSQYNDATSQWERVRGNTQGTLLASAARTATTSTSNQTNYNATGVVIWLNITAASGTGGLTLQIYGVDPVSTTATQLHNNPTAVTTTGEKVYVLAPGSPATGGAVLGSFSMVLPRIWLAQIAVGDASSYTYSLAYALVL